MRIKLTFQAPEKIVLPVGYFAKIQAFIYKNLPEDSGTWLHDVGYHQNNRRFKLFVFSDILQRGNYISSKKITIFPKIISLYIASPIPSILEKLESNLYRNHEELYLGNNILTLKQIEWLTRPALKKNRLTIKALTPIEVHTTHIEDGKKQTRYHSPFDDDFPRLINNNIKQKWEALYKTAPPGDLAIEPISGKPKTYYFKTRKHHTVINGWKGLFSLEGDPALLQLALNSGLGSKNAQGFGMIDIH